MKRSRHVSTDAAQARAVSDRRRRFRLPGTGLVCAAAVIACSDAPGDADAPGTFTLVEDVRVSSDVPDPAYELTDIRQLAAHSRSGSVFVVQGQLADIRVFTQDGRYSHTIGRAGSGPGEFRSITAMGLHGDTVWTIDDELRRVSLFAVDGALLTTWQLEPGPSNFDDPNRVLYPYYKSLLPDGSLLGFGAAPMFAITSGDVTATPLLALTSLGRTTDTLAWVPIGNAHMAIQDPGSGTAYRAQPFGDAPLQVYAPLARRVYVVERGAASTPATHRYAVAAHSSNGDSLWRREVAYEPRPLLTSIADSVRARYVRAYRPRFSPEAVERALYVPAHWSAVTEAIAGDDGSLWLRREEDTTGVQFDVLDRDGVLRMLVRAPPRVRLRWADDRSAWGFTLDEDDVPMLVRYRFVTDSI